MSLTTPFGSPAAPASAPAPSPSPDPQPAGSSRRPLLLVGAVLAVLAVAAGAYLLLFSGSSVDDASQDTITPRPPAAKTAVAPAAPPSAAPTAITRKAAVKARNPFIALVTAPGAPLASTSGGTVPGASSAPSSAPGVPSSGSTLLVPGAPVVPVAAPVVPPAPIGALAPVVVPVPLLAPLAAVPTRPVTPATTTVRMGTVTSDNTVAQLTVGSQRRLVRPGQTFGGFTLVNLHDGSCGAVRHGSIVFDLCEGSSRTLR